MRENPRARADAAVFPGGFSGRAGSLAPLAGLRAAIAALAARELEVRTPFLWLPIAFGLGIAAYFAAADEPARWAGPVLALVALGLAVPGRGLWRALALALGFMALGFSAASLRTALVAAPMLERERIAEVRGFVEAIDYSANRQRLTIRPTAIAELEPGALPYRLRVGAPGRTGASPGDFVALNARLSPPSEAALPGGYDFRREAYFKGFGGVGFAIGGLKQEAAPGLAPLDLRFNAAVDRARNALTERIARAIGGEAGALAAALITGKRGLIGAETNENLRASGLYHIVSISGLHMVLAAGILFWFARAMLAAIPALALRHPIKKYAALVAMAGATAYCVFSGSEVATERSLLMTLVMLGAILVDRPALAMRNVALSALLVLAREPEALAGPSFQMSYAAVACLIAANQIWQDRRAGAPPVERGWFGRIAMRLVLGLAGIVATTLVATLATAPFSAFHFSRLNPYGIIGNTLAIPLVSLVVMPAAVAGTLLVPFGLDGIVWIAMGIGIEGVLWVAERVAAIENASFPLPGIRGTSFALLVASLILFVCLRTALRWVSLGLAALAGLAFAPPAPPDLVVDAHGRMALIRNGEGRYALLAPGGGNRFTLQQWLPALGDSRAVSDPSLNAGIRCDKQGCVGRLADGRRVALVTRLDALRLDCSRADIVITPLPAPADCGAARLVAREHLARHGATLVTSADATDWRLQTALDPAITRPWRKPPLPMATRSPEAAPANLFAPSTGTERRNLPLTPEDPALAPQ